jgi:O-antigen/teichoic acid export membrane protein
LNISDAKKIFHYGVKSETSYFFQFLNYRASYFFISAWLGLGSLGLFSVAIALTEAIWIISKSISSVHYSNIINTDDPVQRIKLTEKAALNSFLFSFAAIIIIYFIPEDIFTYAFGKDFTGIKPLIVYMFPGVIAIAVSNIYGHYFSGIGKMNILIIKSLLGLILTIAFIFILLKKYELTGACIILNISYITSSLYLYFMFRKEKKKIIAQ